MKIVIPEYDEKEIQKQAKRLDINIDCLKILNNRNVAEDIMKILFNEDWTKLLPHDSIDGTHKACELIYKYLEDDNATIYIYGDYDNDGIQSTYIAYDCLNYIKKLNNSKCTIDYYIPERNEGYGLNISWCYDIVNNNKNDKPILVITVDNGITKRYEVDYLLMNNVDVVVTDHHCPQEGLIPDCVVIDELLNDNSEHMGLCGAGVIFKVCAHLLNYYYNEEAYALYYLPNVATATISDMMPVTLENSIFVRNGLYLLNDKEYLQYCNSDALKYYTSFRGKRLTPKDIAFEFGPQINSCGRMGNVNVAMNFMKSESNLNNLYKEVVELNDERKNRTKQMVEDIEPYINNDCYINNVIYDVAGGCAGLLANKLTDIYGKPAIVFSDKGDYYSGSARSVDGINLQYILKLLQDEGIVRSFGGHAAACGVCVDKDKIDLFNDSINQVIYDLMNLSDDIDAEEPTIYVDEKIEVKDISMNTIKKYKDILFYNNLELPKFYLENVIIDNVRYSFNNPNNIKFTFKDKTGESEAWSWGYGKTYENLGKPKKVNMVIEIELESFNKQLVINVVYMEAA